MTEISKSFEYYLDQAENGFCKIPVRVAQDMLEALRYARGTADLAMRQRDEAEAEVSSLRSRVEAMGKALERPFAVLFLDDRNEHGTHVLPSFPTGIDPSDLVRELEAGSAEAVMQEAERLGFKAGDHVWTNWHCYPCEPFSEHTIWEFIAIDVERSKYINARTARAVKGDSDAE